MILSIVMMIKDEEKYLEKTLKSLVPMMKLIKTELIILDTGSIDKSIEIAKKYTDKVYFSEWNNNFGSMRNKSISYASGKWILILDADEELINYDEIINFFNSDLHRRYNTASITLKNIQSEDGKSYTKTSIPRLFKNRKGFRYEGAIHEQPIYLNPIYNNILEFKHYGYIYTDEEIKQRKLKRNEKILYEELERDNKNPYIHYQLAKNYMAYGKWKDALYYMNNAYDIYNKKIEVPIMVKSNLARIYIALDQNRECEKLCLDYIEKDENNIDIYYFLGIAQKSLGKYENSLKSYEKYLYLVDNYQLSTQFNDTFCDSSTVSLKDFATINVLEIYFNLKKYDIVLDLIKDMSEEMIDRSYNIILKSLFETNKYSEILELYEKKLNKSIVKKSNIQDNIENMIASLRDVEKHKIYKILSRIKDNYGILNKIRLGEKFEIHVYKSILDDENKKYYGDIIYYSDKQNIDIIEILKGLKKCKVKEYIEYIVLNRKDYILELYHYISSQPNTLEIEKISILSLISKEILLNGNLEKSKKEELFLMYTNYRYTYLEYLYSLNKRDKIIELIDDKEDDFVINIMMEKANQNDKLKYIRKIKELALNNPQYKDGIQFLIDEFSRDIQESKEFKALRDNLKSIIKDSINQGDFNNAIEYINEYLIKFDIDSEILNLKSIVAIYNNDFISADIFLKKSYMMDRTNYDVMFNIAYTKENIGNIKEAINFYNYIILNSHNKELKETAQERISMIYSQII